MALAMAGLVAEATSALIYWQLIAPGLPQWQAVPLAWWSTVLLPIGLVIVWAGYRARSLSDVFMSAAVIVVPWAAARAVYGVVRKRPVGHDVWAGDLSHFVMTTTQLILCGVAVGCIAAVCQYVRNNHAPLKSEI